MAELDGPFEEHSNSSMVMFLHFVVSSFYFILILFKIFFINFYLYNDYLLKFLLKFTLLIYDFLN